MTQRRDAGKPPNLRRRSRGGPPPTDAGGRDDDAIIEGRNPVLEALKSGRPINKVLIAEGVGRAAVIAEITRLAGERGAAVERVDSRALDRLSVTGRSQGVAALAAAKEYASLEELLQTGARRGEPPLLLLLDGIQDPHNLGAIIRTADGAGVHGVVIPKRRSAGLTAAVARASAGAVEHVPVARAPNISDALARLSKENVWTVAIDPGGPAGYTEIDYRLPTAIVIGAEGRGVSRLVRERCDVVASIPMRGRVASLNASVSAALVMYEAMRQRIPPKEAR